MTSFLPIPKNFSSSTSSSTGIATLQKRLFGRKNSQEDPLPVVLLSYKADYDETLPIQGSIKIAISYSDLLFMIWHFPPYDWLSSDYSSSLAEMRSTWRPSFSDQLQGLLDQLGLKDTRKPMLNLLQIFPKNETFLFCAQVYPPASLK